MKYSAFESPDIARRIVEALSYAEIPVVIPWLASIEIVKAVYWGTGLYSGFMGWRPMRSAFSLVKARQIRPLPFLAIKLMVSGVAYSAATTRSPSFSLSLSSTSMTILPLLISERASSMELIGILSSTSYLKIGNAYIL